MEAFLERGEYEFFSRAGKFCENIDKYILLFKLDIYRVEAFKQDYELLAYVFTNIEQYSTCAESFASVKVSNMAADFSYLSHLCRNSKNYTEAIGRELGIEIPVYGFHAN